MVVRNGKSADQRTFRPGCLFVLALFPAIAIASGMVIKSAGGLLTEHNYIYTATQGNSNIGFTTLMGFTDNLATRHPNGYKLRVTCYVDSPGAQGVYRLRNVTLNTVSASVYNQASNNSTTQFYDSPTIIGDNGNYQYAFEVARFAGGGVDKTWIISAQMVGQ